VKKPGKRNLFLYQIVRKRGGKLSEWDALTLIFAPVGGDFRPNIVVTSGGVKREV